MANLTPLLFLQQNLQFTRLLIIQLQNSTLKSTRLKIRLPVNLLFDNTVI